MSNAAPFSSGCFTILPNETFKALTVPEGKTFILTDVIVFPLIEKHDPDFVVRYTIREGTKVKFQYNAVGTEANWSQHLTSGIKFKAGGQVNVSSWNGSTGRAGFQLIGTMTTP